MLSVIDDMKQLLIAISRVFLTLTVLAVLIFLLDIQVNGKHKIVEIISNKSGLEITLKFSERTDFSNAYLEITAKDPSGIDTLEILNESTQQTVITNFAKSSPIYFFSDRYELKNIFEKNNARRLPLKVTVRNINNEANSVSATIELR